MTYDTQGKDITSPADAFIGIDVTVFATPALAKAPRLLLDAGQKNGPHERMTGGDGQELRITRRASSMGEADGPAAGPR